MEIGGRRVGGIDNCSLAWPHPHLERRVWGHGCTKVVLVGEKRHQTTYVYANSKGWKEGQGLLANSSLQLP